jgi:AraC-like DNA-binding protein
MAVDWKEVDVAPRAAVRVQWRRGVAVDRSWPGHVADHHIWFVLGGRAEVRLRRQWVALRAGSAVWMVPGGNYPARHDPRRPLLFHAVHFDLIDRATGKPVADPGLALPRAVHGMHTAMTHALMSLVVGPRDQGIARRTFDGPGGARAIAFLTALLAAFETRLDAMHVGSDASESASAVRRRIDESAGQLIRDLANPPSVAELATALGLSPHNYSQRFRRRFGYAPRMYVQHQRLVKARTLLLETAMSVKEIAFQLGYHDTAHFSHQFKLVHGISPTIFRRHYADG